MRLSEQSSELRDRLCRVSKFDVTISFEDQAPANGRGRVDVEQPGSGVLVWREYGQWQECFNNLEFTNVYRWTRMDNGRMSLEHLRLGDMNPVRLVEIEKTDNPGGSASWTSAYPHLCGKDRYDLKLIISRPQLNLVWTISGPAKNQVSTVCYR